MNRREEHEYQASVYAGKQKVVGSHIETSKKDSLMKIAIVTLYATALSGCMGNLGYGNMSAEQIKALGKESNIACVDFTGMWGRGKSVFVNVDKSVIDKGGIEVTPDCSIKFMNERQFAPPKIADPKLPDLPALQWSVKP